MYSTRTTTCQTYFLRSINLAPLDLIDAAEPQKIIHRMICYYNCLSKKQIINLTYYIVFMQVEISVKSLLSCRNYWDINKQMQMWLTCRHFPDGETHARGGLSPANQTFYYQATITCFFQLA